MCKMINILVISLFAVIFKCEGQILLSGQCEDSNVLLQANFDFDRFIGTTNTTSWYEFSSTDHPLAGDCSSINFTRVGDAVTVTHRAVRENFLSDYHGTASVPAGTAMLTLNMPTVSNQPINFWVWLTDYDNFALIYNCVNVGTTQRRYYIWQLSRNPAQLSEMMEVFMNNTLISVGINSDDLRVVDHGEDACTLLPVVLPGEPVVLPGQCDENITVVQNFSAANFLGVWHEISSYYSENALGTCGRAQYSSQDGIVVDIVNSQVINQTLLTIEGSATVVSNDTSGRLNVVLQISPNITSETELLIIATDYNQWAISYSCDNLANNQKRVYSWIVSRTRTLPAAAQAQVDAVVDSITDLNRAYYQPTDQTNSGCFYVPEVVEGEPAVFGGQCDQTISVQPNFNATNYLGLWHDIESFPTPFQFGACSNAYYSLGDGGVDVYNTQVINETLDFINGVATLVGNEAKLVVSFPVAGTNQTTSTDYWILSTDYSSYSLVYSCRNINDFQQQVFMWKLSRTKSLSSQAIANINNTLATETVFDERFFQPVDQSSEGCFYYPEPVLGKPVVFPGQCEDEEVSVVQNINLNLFAGQWLEAQAYPKEFQPGQCVRHEFTVAGNNAFNLTSNSVADQLLGVTTSQLTFLNGTDARFILSISNGTDFISIPYYIIATDYYDYALAYSCVNLDDDFKGVYSWKLSRNQELTNTSLTTISNIMANYTVLAEEYFEPVDQTDFGCFYFPDLAPGEAVVLPGQCEGDDVIPVVNNFNASAYLGRWHLIESYPSAFQVGACNRAEYSLNTDGTVNVYNTEVVNQTLSEATGVATLVLDANNQTIGKFQVTFPESPVPFELRVLDTDYDNYALVYGCVNLNNLTRQVLSWKMSRTTTLTAESVTAIDAVTSNVTVLNDRYYETVNNSDAACFYYPEVVDSSTLVFRGQCDENINVVTNFNAVGYMGLWHDIERYPAPFQNGTCGNAFYTLQEGPVVDVFNTQVFNRTLDTISGFAVLDLVDANDTSAKLQVTFPSLGTNASTPYWVLSTDYTSYALVYSCSNIDTESRAVTSWKLSRTKTLSPTAIAQINQVVNAIDVLDERYFIPQDQTSNGCFYYPEPQPGVPVVFPGQCDLNTTVVQNFNLTAFQGLWHEIEAFPKVEQDGQCINHQFTLSDASTFNFTSSDVFAQSLGVTTGTVSFAFNDTTGRLTLEFISNNTLISIPYWIIDTDYENYALAYSCVNQNSDFRGVWSWKLSRTKELSNTSSSAIDNAIAGNEVLDNVYYEPVAQTDDACFYLPDIEPGEPVIFPGQCDTNIRGIENFNASRYLGLWRTIETYASNFQLGTCGDATYTLNNNGSVDVFNTEVINQTLSTINGLAVVSSENGTGELLVYFPDALFPSQYYILDTDYDNYALVYSCFNINDVQRRVYSWKLSRTNTLSQAAETAINQVVNNTNVLDDRYYQLVDRSYSGCFYYPESDGRSSVIFRGQCDDNITVVTNFDAVGYMGLWHDIERYPAPFQNATCGNAFYTLREGPVVDVFNTQVFNQTLDTISGFAVLDLVDANDTSAKLQVTFPSLGTNASTPYWVLSTDYTSYALVYSCSNIDTERKSVTSWKLSRAKTLSPTAIAQINQVVNAIDVLDERYFLQQDQTSDGCFYYPEPQPGVPIVFPGQCDLNATVVQNFNLTAFQGLWHEIEAYPKDEQDGQCINHQFTLSDASTFNFTSSDVFAQSLGVTTGTVSFAFNDTTGRLTLEFISNNTLFSIPYWIIDTDYENYALAYSCVNQNSDFRGVWSWKLSRTKALPNTFSNAIDNAIAGNEVLDNVYYEPVAQTDDACFYLPDIEPGEPVIFPGQCDTNIRGIENFNASRYLGLWRTIETYASNFQLGTCGDATYTLNNNGSVDVFNTEVINQTLSTINGLAVVSSENGTGELLVYFPDALIPSQYYILDTDYDNYALVYSCFNINAVQRRVYSWKLSRTNTLSQAAETAINQVVNNTNVLDDRYYQLVDRSYSGCFYYPESDGSSSVVFRGQCDDNITVVTNFDAVGYMGLWHDIERYPAPFQNATCGNAFYTLREGPVVDVFNTQVFNQTLDTISGFAVLDLVDANDTSAKLQVTFPSLGTNASTPYWVLSTDYTSYALVYSCSNIDTERKSVTSWKLSRAKTLSPTAIAQINQVVNAIDVLDERYFIQQDQTSDGCFYYPEPQPGVPVVFPGQCDLNATVVQNFNLTAFEGLWHEIEAYPKDEQDGQCINHQFTLSDASTFNFTSSDVFAQSLGVTTGTVSFAFNDTTGRLTLEFISNNTLISIPYWIIDTDYENYALAYSCVNQNSDFKGVWSWKLSRTKELSNTSSSAIDNAIAGNEVLDNVYYEPVAQTDDACFYLPDIEPGEPVIFPGQCDTNIRGIENFNASRYLGLWRNIETYASNFQLGTCGDATYTLNNNGSVDVFNTEVVNQTLSTINGLAVVSSEDGTGELLVYFPDAPIPSIYYILDTDYDNYALVYSCFNINSNQQRVYSWKLSRSNSLSQQAQLAIDAAISQVNVLNSRYYEVVNRTDESCFYYPEPNDNPVVFRGQCDDNVDVVMNFDASRYAGEWFNIESYPAPFQDGSCGTANYDLDLNTLVVYVENTQVVNPDGFGPVLDVQTGTAVLASNDTSAKLLVTFEVNGANVTSDYWVLDTDYDSYALVYSCQNLNAESRQVNSWKLSRTRNLTAEASFNITQVVNRVEVLDEQYFRDGNQTEADCFFYPDNNGGDVILEGQCLPDNQVDAVLTFDANMFGGLWHEVARFPSDFQRGECTAAEVSVSGQNIDFMQTEVDNEFQYADTINGTLSADGRGVINAVINGSAFNFYVLGVNYSDWALLYGCRNINNYTKQIYSWKLSRSQSGLSSSASTSINSIVGDNIDLFENYFYNTDQSNAACFYYPEFSELPPVINMPGPCNESIMGVPNFSAANYLGRWIEVERYPQPDQFGTCDRAYYSPGEGNVLVRNTQVVENSLAEQLGFAEVASTDGTGLLNVTFVVNGTTVYANYYVLATDYNNFALVYSCRNLENGWRQVSSWKLSRTTSLSNQANAAIDIAISQTQGLDQRYYQATNQTDEACFYVPEVNVNEAPVFRGQCDDNIAGVANFNATRYAGWWHEIERYPVDNYRGECISSQYQGSGNTYLVTDTVVANGSATVSSGTVQVTANGRLIRTINGQVQDLWVLDTDYDTYSVLYSCESVDSSNEYRRIWSAKHSKTRQLTAAAQSAIATVIDGNQLLYPQFYQPVDQSNAACFHYPEATGQRVILPGQCDDNIPVEQNFNVQAYGGTWYQIEKYPSNYENTSSTCIGARYTLDSSGTISVLNWEVIDGQLMTIEGNATVTSSDGSARLTVVLPVRDSPTNAIVSRQLFVLNTDYENFALVYTCTNVNDFQRSIGAWKLSRTRTLAPQYHAIINEYASLREELHQPYFQPVQHDEDCEEPNAGALVKSSIIVMIICALWQILS